jgi:hypothetical protein
MDKNSYHYKDNAKDTEAEENPSVVPHIRTIEVDCHFRCDICKIKLAGIFQEGGNYCLDAGKN